MGKGFGKQMGNTLAGGFRNDVFGTTEEADAAQQAALQQQRTAQQMRTEAVGQARTGATNMADLAKATPQELQAYNQSLSAASDQLSKQQKLLDSIDPAIMEASKQVLSVLRGDQTGIGGAMGNQRNAQRAQLVSSLRAQYGPGAESSSIGQRTLSAFDRETATMGEQQRAGTLNSLMGTINARPSANGAIAGLSAAGANFGGIQSRQLGAAEAGNSGILNAMSGTGQNVINSAGADQTGRMITSGAQRAFWDNWSNSSMKFGENMGGMGMGKASGGGGGGGGATGFDGNYDPNSMSNGGSGNSYFAGNFQSQPYR